jgi:KipI family sensor histidine kinase inhibitor
MADYRFIEAADSAVIVEFGDAIDRGVSERVLALADAVRAADIAGVTDVVATFRSLLVRYDSLLVTGREIEAAVAQYTQARGESRGGRRLWRIPACYDPAFAPDLDDVARAAGLATREVGALHAATRFHVYMVGFAPGYAYMGDTPDALRLPRRTDPRTRVPPGSVAIATGLTAVYPYESPGGWHLIGTTPLRFFDAASERGALLQPGDAVQFEAVSATECAAIAADVARGTYAPAFEDIAS